MFAWEVLFHVFAFVFYTKKHSFSSRSHAQFMKTAFNFHFPVTMVGYSHYSQSNLIFLNFWRNREIWRGKLPEIANLKRGSTKLVSRTLVAAFKADSNNDKKIYRIIEEKGIWNVTFSWCLFAFGKQYIYYH